MKYILPIVAVVLVAGCSTVSSPVPDGYKGPVVSLADSGMQEDGSKGQFFVVLELDGRAVQNALGETRSASYGRGFSLTSRYTTRDVPAMPMKVKLLATHQTAAPIHEIASRMAGTFYSAGGTVDFTPVVGRKYVVTGELKKERSCVWIQEDGTKEPATEKACTK